MTSLAPARPKPVITRIPCLRCRKDFDSEGPWNRVCAPCNLKNTKQGTPAQRVRATVPDPSRDDDWR